MVSLWPWKGDSSDAASFEKTLSKLSTKISKISSRLDSLRSHARQAKVTLVLYGGFLYIVASLILILVTGWKNWNANEYTFVAGAPVLMYGIRYALASYYDYRISTTSSQLDSLYKERDATIERLKAATKYNSTQQLLEKYGSQRSTPKKESPSQKKQSPASRGQRGGRTGVFAPPPTANIARGPNGPSPQNTPTPPRPSTGFGHPPQNRSPIPHGKPLPPVPRPQLTEEFAPNAFSPQPQYAAPGSSEGGNWYDKIMDALLGEDETQPRNRIVLICQNCRLVNGQAPPGTKRAEDIGKWRCGGCGALNGEESEAKKIVDQLSGARPVSPPGPQQEISMEDDADSDEMVDVTMADVEDDGGENTPDPSNGEDIQEESNPDAETDTPAKSTRSKAKGKGRKKG
ncbi:hypothetical protein K402DRAFT_354441 [Aulographum hederae CBS 113979]|uniref:Endoplasmic reticulum junction formation protein lunapark n=1 Tax=Aulographum hederae CBS 113979 TaxID=1176131 RepID=A0A6G1H211_9PEZI|nr:hypothetical protein K402DRAFT_354441 [Aulographum hederae CBS 113979]